MKREASAKKLIHQLDKRNRNRMRPCLVVALATSLGPIYGWQKHKLKNLEFALKHGDVQGFVTLNMTTWGLQVDLCPITDPDYLGIDPESLDVLIDSIKGVLGDFSEHDGFGDDVNEDFQLRSEYERESSKKTA